MDRATGAHNRPYRGVDRCMFNIFQHAAAGLLAHGNPVRSMTA